MVEFIKQKKGIIIVVIIILIVVAKNMYGSTKDYNIIEEQEILVTENTTDKEIEEDNNMIAIHITGSVKNPGVVKVQDKSRIEDVIKVAGGLTDDADITNVNLAYVVEDGIKIRIPSIYDEDDTEEEYITEDSGDGVVVSSDSTNNLSSLININKATQTELETLTGIGPSLATKIIEYREKNGGFKNIEDIKNVSGIGNNKFENIKDYIEV